MLCDNCKINNAILKYKQNINNKEIEYNLCSNCAKSFEEELLFSNIFKDFFVDFGNNIFDKRKEMVKCEICGNTLDSIKSTGKMGCNNCYKVFKQNILPIIKNFQFDYNHIGKGAKIDEEDKIKIQVIELKNKLKEAVKAEDYELAITLRDKIKELEKGD